MSASTKPVPNKSRVSCGVPLPLGVHDCCEGVNFAVFSRHATSMALLLFDHSAQDAPSERIELDPRRHRTGDIWHVRLERWRPGQLYALQADGPHRPEEGHRFDAGITLLDPYASLVAGRQDWHAHAASGVPLSVIADHDFDWQDDKLLRRPWCETVIYETHVRGLTIHPSSGVRHRGQYLGVVEKIPYFQALGITALELMPVQAFDPRGLNRVDPLTGAPLVDYWGYNPLALFAPMAGYASADKPHAVLCEFKTMVRELHKAGIEIILDVVFNHTAEGGENGPTLSFRGLDNSIYYLLDPASRARYTDYTGCGNTLNCNHPVVRAMIVECLHHWVMHFHIDGFRFDLASVLGRDASGRLLENPPLLEQIAEDPLLRDTKLIAEAWDAGGAFQVGSFPGTRWAEWNSHFRDEVRRFWRGDPGLTGRFASRLAGSADLYEHRGERPINSINFVTSHDGFTLNDLVSYARKHNESNGENNRDGSDENYADSYGVEGPGARAEIEAVRERQIRNMLATLFVSRGVPMLSGGDEFRRTQNGNNNAYCQDNETSWYDWALVAQNAALVRFVSRLGSLRRAHPVLATDRFYTSAEIQWLGTDGFAPGWDGHHNRVGCMIREQEGGALCLLFNATTDTVRFALPSPPSGRWRIALDTSRAAPDDAPGEPARELLPDRRHARVAARSVMVVVSA